MLQTNEVKFMDKENSQLTNKKGAFVELLTTLIFSLALGVPIIWGVFIAINGYYRAWDKGDWTNILLLVIGILLLCIFEMPGWLALRKAKKEKELTNTQ